VNLLVLLIIALSPSLWSGSPQNDVAGAYLKGDGLGDSLFLEIHRDGTFSATIAGDIGPAKPISGRVTEEAGYLRFVSEVVVESLAGRWHVVPWGSRKYLVEEGSMIDFANAVNLGVEPRRTELGSFLLRRTSLGRAPSGRPNLPPSWARLVLRKPLSGKVSEVRNGGLVEITLGTTDDVFVGMLLSAQFPDGTGADLVVVEVREKTCVARGTAANLRVGTRVTSRQ
jgi:hypothetical protein